MQYALDLMSFYGYVVSSLSGAFIQDCALHHVMYSKVRCTCPVRKQMDDLLVAGGAIFGVVLAALIILTAVALAGFLVHSKWTKSYVRSDSDATSVAEQHLHIHNTQLSGYRSMLSATALELCSTVCSL